MNNRQLHRIHSVPACANDCSQGRGDCPTPDACRIPARVTGANLPTWRAQVHETAEQAEGWMLAIGIAACVAGTAVLIFAPAEWLMAWGLA
jgi:hypothetical protein